MNDRKGLIVSILSNSLAVLFLGPSADATPVHIFEWNRQLDRGVSFASADEVGSVYVSGSGRILGSPGNVVLHRVSAAGDLAWSRSYGPTSRNSVRGVSADGLGNVYLGGLNDIFIGNAFLAKYDGQGNFLWDRIIGSNKGTEINGVAADGLGNVNVAGFAREAIGSGYYGNRDGFVSKYDASGNLLWARQIGTDQLEEFLDIAADGLGNVYAVGDAIGDSSLVDALVTKFDATGNLLWSKNFGSAGLDYGTSVAADAIGNVYVAGITGGNLDGDNKGLYDGFVTKLDATGNVHWSRQFGTSSSDEAGGVATDGLGNVFVSGYVKDGGSPGIRDGFLAKFDASGNALWNLPMGDYVGDLSSDRQGNLYVLGATTAIGPFVAKIHAIPEPSTITLFVCALCLAATINHRRI